MHAQMLVELDLIEQAIACACEMGAFIFALELANVACKQKIGELHVKHGHSLRDTGYFQAAEEAFIKGSSPNEAIDMYLHMMDWDNAHRVAEVHSSERVQWVLEAQAMDPALYIDVSKIADANRDVYFETFFMVGILRRFEVY